MGLLKAVGWAGGKVGKGIWGLGNGIAAKVGEGTIWAGKKAGKAMPGVLDKTGSATAGAATGSIRFGIGVANTPNAINPMSHAKMFKNFAEGLVEHQEGKIVKDAAGKVIKETEGGYRTTWMGKSVLAAGGLAYGAHDAMNTFEESRMGYGDQQMTTATPNYAPNRIPDNGGATGDLVFAMNRNRRG